MKKKIEKQQPKKIEKQQPKKIEKQNTSLFGVLSLCVGWVIPPAGVILGIISLERKENTKWLGILGIILSTVFFMFWLILFFIIEVIQK
jgi:hypothetical protein